MADKLLRKKILEIGVRKISREIKVDSKTIMLIARGQSVKPATLKKILEYPLIQAGGASAKKTRRE